MSLDGRIWLDFVLNYCSFVSVSMTNSLIKYYSAMNNFSSQLVWKSFTKSNCLTVIWIHSFFKFEMVLKVSKLTKVIMRNVYKKNISISWILFLGIFFFGALDTQKHRLDKFLTAAFFILTRINECPLFLQFYST